MWRRKRPITIVSNTPKKQVENTDGGHHFNGYHHEEWKSTTIKYDDDDDDDHVVVQVLQIADYSKKGFQQQNTCFRKRRISMLLLMILVMLLTSLSLLLMKQYERILQRESPSWWSSLDAIVTVAMCGFDATEMVRALRTMGGWKGPIYVITDTTTPTFHNRHRQNDNHNENDGSILYTEINVRGNHPIFDTQQEWEQYVQGIHRFGGIIYSKWHKTQIFKLIPPQDNINNVLFLDADILAQKSLIDHWLPDIEHLLMQKKIHRHRNALMEENCPISLYPERWYTSFPLIGKYDTSLSGKYNSGMMILKRCASQTILDKWGDALIRPPFVGRDQGKLTQVLEELGTHVCSLPNHWVHVQNEADIIDRTWFKIVGKGTFLHISSAKMREKRYQHWNHQLMQECNYTNLVFPSIGNVSVSVKVI
jgi:hypothetical protein